MEQIEKMRVKTVEDSNPFARSIFSTNDLHISNRYLQRPLTTNSSKSGEAGRSSPRLEKAPGKHPFQSFHRSIKEPNTDFSTWIADPRSASTRTASILAVPDT